MALLLEIGLTNAALATVLAGVVCLAAWRWPNPALGHVLWLLVLARLLAPPLFSVPLPSLRSPEPLAETALLPIIDAATTPLPSDARPSNAAVVPSPPPLAAPTLSDRAAIHWPDLIGGLWIASSLAVLAVLARRAWRFRRIVAAAAPASDELQARVDELSARLEVRRPPRVLQAHGRFPPALWGLGRRAVVLLPVDFLARLDRAEIETILTHELAHLKRGDSWVRCLEAAALVLFWWHPIA